MSYRVPPRRDRRRWSTLILSLLVHALVVLVLLVALWLQPKPRITLDAEGTPVDVVVEAPQQGEIGTSHRGAEEAPPQPTPTPAPSAPSPQPTPPVPEAQPAPAPPPVPVPAPTPPPPPGTVAEPAAPAPPAVAAEPAPPPTPSAPTEPLAPPQPPAVRLAEPDETAPPLAPPPVPIPSAPAPLPPLPAPSRPAPPRVASPAPQPRAPSFNAPIDLSDLSGQPRATRIPGPPPVSRSARAPGAIDLALGPIARNSVGAPPRSTDRNDVSVRVTGANVGDDWYRALHAWWDKHGYYPERAAALGEDGTVGLHFTVDRFGHVSALRVTTPSGSQWLDLGAQATFRGAPLPPFPLSTPENSAEVDVTINYILIRR